MRVKQSCFLLDVLASEERVMDISFYMTPCQIFLNGKIERGVRRRA